MKEQLLALLTLALFAAIALSIAVPRRFFRVEREEKSNVSLLALVVGALIFFGLSLISSLLALVALLLFVAFALKNQPWGSGPVWKGIGIGALTWLLAFPLAEFAGIGVQAIFQIELVEQVAVREIRALLGHPVLFAIATVATVVVIPIVEELLFRGLLQGWLSRWLPGWWAVAVASLLFAAAHFAPSQGTTNIVILAQLFVFSLFLGHVYRRQRTLWAPIALHATFNAITMVQLIFVDAIDLPM